MLVLVLHLVYNVGYKRKLKNVKGLKYMNVALRIHAAERKEEARNVLLT